MHAIKYGQRGLERKHTSIRELSPLLLVKGDYRRRVFGKSKTQPSVGVQVAVCDVMNELANSPALRPVRSLQLVVVQILDCLAKTLR